MDEEADAVTCDVTMSVLTLLPPCVITELKDDTDGVLDDEEDALEEDEDEDGGERVVESDAAESPTGFWFLPPPRENRSLDVLQQD